MTCAVYAGTFDPITNGHVEVIRKAYKMFDELIVLVARNEEKKPALKFSERIDLTTTAVQKEVNGCHIEVMGFDGLLANFVKDHDVNVLVRGLRNFIDFEYEFQMASVNRMLMPGVETAFIMSNEQNVNVSSSVVRQLMKYNAPIQHLVPRCVNDWYLLRGSKAIQTTQTTEKVLVSCPYCNGKGEILAGGGSTPVESIKCRRCDGKGKI